MSNYKLVIGSHSSHHSFSYIFPPEANEEDIRRTIICADQERARGEILRIASIESSDNDIGGKHQYTLANANGDTQLVVTNFVVVGRDVQSLIAFTLYPESPHFSFSPVFSVNAPQSRGDKKQSYVIPALCGIVLVALAIWNPHGDIDIEIRVILGLVGLFLTVNSL
jgi:hypothetical protein